MKTYKYDEKHDTLYYDGVEFKLEQIKTIFQKKVNLQKLKKQNYKRYNRFLPAKYKLTEAEFNDIKGWIWGQR